MRVYIDFTCFWAQKIAIFQFLQLFEKLTNIFTNFETFFPPPKKKRRTSANFRILIFFRGVILRNPGNWNPGNRNLGGDRDPDSVISSETTWGSRVRRPGIKLEMNLRSQNSQAKKHNFCIENHQRLNRTSYPVLLGPGVAIAVGTWIISIQNHIYMSRFGNPLDTP